MEDAVNVEFIEEWQVQGKLLTKNVDKLIKI